MIAWDVYAEDKEFDDIYIDDFDELAHTGIDCTNSTFTANTTTRLTGNSTGIYDNSNVAPVYSCYKSGIIAGLTADYTSTQINCSAWSDINSVAITQTLSGTRTASIIYHAISFDGGSTYKAFQGGTWNTVNTDTMTWTKNEIEAMIDADWNASSGWSTSVNTINWITRNVNGTSWDASNTGSTTCTSTLSSNGTTASTDNEYSGVGLYAYKAFTGTNTNDSDCWCTYNTSFPCYLKYDFGAGVTKVINKYSFTTRNSSNWWNPPNAFKLQASNDNSTWTDLDSTSISQLSYNTVWTSSTLSNTTAYRYYRILISSRYDVGGGTSVTLGELRLIEATYSAATPTFTKATINYDTAISLYH